MRNGKELEEVEKEPKKVEKGKKVVKETPKEDDTESSKPAPEVKDTSLRYHSLLDLNSMHLTNSLLSSLISLRNCISISILLML